MTMELNLHINRSFRRVIVSLLLVAGGVSSLFAVNDSTLTRNDTSTIILREPNTAEQEKIFGDDEWKYITEAPTPDGEKSWFDRLLDNLLESLLDDLTDQSSSRSSGSNFNGWTIFFMIVGAALIIFFVLKATGTGGNLMFKGKSKRKADVDATLEDVDIHAINYETDIALAKSKNDYRLAVRLWFLRSLKEMTDLGLINWKIDKTNSDYYYELSGNDLQRPFGSVSLLYDYVWYGDFEIDSKKYNEAESELNDYYVKVKQTPAKE